MKLPERPRVVLDTNVLVAAARSSSGAAFALVSLLPSERWQPLVSTPLVLEYEAVLKRPEHLQGRSHAQVEALLDDLCAWGLHVSTTVLWRPQTRDVADDMVLETALNGSAHALVTFNVRDFMPAARHFGLQVWQPGEFLQALVQKLEE